MCAGCWVQSGHPTMHNAQVDEAVGLINDLYRIAPTGGPLHAVVDDWNVEDGDLVVRQVHRSDGLPCFSGEVLKVAGQLAEVLREMTMAERLSTLAHQEGILADGQPTVTGASYLVVHRLALADDPDTEMECNCRGMVDRAVAC